MHAIAPIREKLKSLVGGIRSAADSIQVDSSEVAAGNQDLSPRTEDAALNLQQTASSMEHLTGIVMNSADAGQTMNEIVTSVQRVSDTFGEITVAASEQSEGIGRINTAIASLDQMTQQNSALVEQSVAAAENLSDQAAQLAATVSIFDA